LYQLRHTWVYVPVNEAIEVTLGPQGRLVLPVALLRRLGLQPGDVLVATADADRLVLERRDAILARLQGRFAHIPPDVSLADELITQRQEAERET
jgi:bifunctional DNA-binding transcriptional regulator/antitoxin component of YhaV-PrlF toxin-antitoxin module